mgnify:CR=1 FL=1
MNNILQNPVIRNHILIIFKKVTFLKNNFFNKIKTSILGLVDKVNISLFSINNHFNVIDKNDETKTH